MLRVCESASGPLLAMSWLRAMRVAGQEEVPSNLRVRAGLTVVGVGTLLFDAVPGGVVAVVLIRTLLPRVVTRVVVEVLGSLSGLRRHVFAGIG